MPSPIIQLTRKKDKVRQKLIAMVPKVGVNLENAMREGANEIAGLARRYAPVETGQLRDSINAHVIDDYDSRADQQIQTSFQVTLQKGKRRGLTVSRAARAIETQAWGIFAHFKWRFVEFGTVDTRAQPFMFPAYRVLRKRVRSRISRAIGKAIRESGFSPR